MSGPEGGAARRAVVITGGGTGIGRATARAFAAAGAAVLIAGRKEPALKETAEGFPGIRWLAIDITELDAPARVVDTAVSELGGIDVLVNNAAVASVGMLGEITRDATSAQLATNLYAPIFLTQQALPELESRRGTVVNVSTAGSLGRRAFPGMSVYGASKVAIDFLTRTWAVELGPRGIQVVAIAPGVIDTGLGERMGWTREENERFLADMRTRVPSGRLGRPEEIAWWIVQVSQPDASYLTGAILAVDGAASNG